MADENAPNTMQDINVNINIPEASAEQLADQTSRIKEAAINLRESAGQYSQMLGRLVESPDVKLPLPPGTDQAFRQAQRGANRFKRTLDSMRNSPGFTAVESGLQNVIKNTGPMGRLIEKTFKGISNHADEFNRILGSGTALGVLIGIEKVLGGIDTRTKVFSKLQQSLIDVHKYALQASMGIGEGFRDAQGSVEDIQTQFGQTMVTTNTLRKDVLEVGETLKQAFSARDTFTGIENLRDGTNKMHSAMNLANIAILASTARGMEATKAADMLANAHLNLGESVETAALIFGQIDQAAENSGMQFSKVADLIMGATDNMKLWGGTVASVTPTFKAFSDALGEGRKGLVEPLFNRYMQGIRDMQVEMRALIGLTAGMGGGGGGTAIGAALQMEALMEKGPEGMAEMSEKLINTIKEFTGGQMLTREQVLENPALENQFMIQRQLLEQMTGSSTAEANQMIEILQKIDENGIEGVENAKERLNELTKSGEDTRKATTNDMVNATLKVEAAIHTQGKQIANVINNLMKSSGARRVVRSAQRATTKMATGDISGLRGIKEFITDISSTDISGKVERLTGRRTRMKEEPDIIRIGKESGLLFVNQLMGELARKRDVTIAGGPGGFKEMRGRPNVVTRMAAGQEINTRFVKKDIQNTIKAITQEISKLQEIKQTGNLTQAQAAKLVTLRQSEQQLQGMARQKRINLSEVGDVNQYTKYNLPPTINRRMPKMATLERRTVPTQDILKQPRIDDVIEKQLSMYNRNIANNMEEQLRHVARRPARIQVEEAQQAAREIKNVSKENITQTPETIEKKIVLKVVPDRQTVTIEVDEARMAEVAKRVTGEIID
jgi:hypothetical protein